MYRQYEPEQNEDVQMQDQQQDMYELMDFEDEQYMHGGGPMYYDPMYYEDDMYEYPMYEYPMYDYEDEDMSRQMGGYGRPHQRRRRRRRRRRIPFFFVINPFLFHHPRPYYDHYDDYDDDYDWD